MSLQTDPAESKPDLPAGRNSFGAQVIVLRLLDQGLWSVAFFAFNILAAMRLDVSQFASVTVATSSGLIGAAVARAFTVDGRVISGAKFQLTAKMSLDRRSIVSAGPIIAFISGVFTSVWLLAGGSSTTFWLPMLSAVIVLADAPHYALTMYGLFERAIIPAALYCALSLTVLGLTYSGISLSVQPIWVVVLLVVYFVEFGAAKPLPWAGPQIVTAGLPLRLSAEALYSALSSQLGILIIFVSSAPSDTAGIRLAYSMIFAPAFMVIQGLYPLFLSTMTELNLRRVRRQVTVVRLWAVSITCGLAVSGGLGVILSVTVWKDSNFEHMLPFILPVGLSILGNLFLDTALLLLRLHTNPRVPHRIRLVLVSVDLLTQLSLAIAWGTRGLVAALIGGFVLKLFVSIFVFWRVKADLFDMRNNRKEAECGGMS